MPPPHPVSCPSYFSFEDLRSPALKSDPDKEKTCNNQGQRNGGDGTYISKAVLAENGLFFLCQNELKCKKHGAGNAITLAFRVWDIDYDDRMLIALYFDGSIVAWKGEIESYYGHDDGSDVDILSRKLHTMENICEVTPHLIRLRGDVGAVCLISHNTLSFVQIETDLSISASSTVDITNKDLNNFTESIVDCSIWGKNKLYVVYSVMGNALHVRSIDGPSTIGQDSVHVHDGWVTAISNGDLETYVSGDSVGTLCFYSIEKEDTDEVDSSTLELTFSVNPFAGAGVSVTSLIVSADSVVWIATSDSVVTCAKFSLQECSIAKLKRIHLHFSGHGPDCILWEPYMTASERPRSNCIDGVLSSACIDTGTIAQTEVFDFSDLTCNCSPMAIQKDKQFGHRKYITCCTVLMKFHALVVVDVMSDLSLWSLHTGSLLLEVDTDKVIGKIISVAGFEFPKMDKYTSKFVLFLGANNGRVYTCDIVRHERQFVYDLQQSATMYSVLDLLNTLSNSKPTGSGVPIDDDDGSLVGLQDLESVCTTENPDTAIEVPDSWDVSVSHFASKFRSPPLPITDIFVSSHGDYVCVIYARCTLCTFSRAAEGLCLHVDLDFDNILDITRVSAVSSSYDSRNDVNQDSILEEKDDLNIAILGKDVLKLFDALTGFITYQVDLKERIENREIAFSYCGVWKVSVGQASNVDKHDVMGILLTNSGKAFAFRNDSPLVLIHERNREQDELSGLDSMDILATGLQIYEIWNSFIVLITFVRSAIIFKFDIRERSLSVLRSQIFKIENEKVSITEAFPLEGDYSRSAPRLLLVLSDGTTCTFNM